MYHVEESSAVKERGVGVCETHVSWQLRYGRLQLLRFGSRHWWYISNSPRNGGVLSGVHGTGVSGGFGRVDAGGGGFANEGLDSAEMFEQSAVKCADKRRKAEPASEGKWESCKRNVFRDRTDGMGIVSAHGVWKQQRGASMRVQD